MLFFYLQQVVCRRQFSDQNQHHAIDSGGAKHVRRMQRRRGRGFWAHGDALRPVSERNRSPPRPSQQDEEQPEYDQDGEIWVYGDQESVRSVKTIRGAKSVLKTSYLVELLIKEHLLMNRGSTLREIYYISENWDVAKFGEQAESDRLVEDLEILTALLREDFHVRPEEDGATVFGPLTISEKTRRGRGRSTARRTSARPATRYPSTSTTWSSRITTRSSWWPSRPAACTLGSSKTASTKSTNAILVHLKGQPARSTRRLIKRLNEELSLPVLVFTDGDPWSYRIFASAAYGAIKSAHLSDYLVTPAAQFVGSSRRTSSTTTSPPTSSPIRTSRP